MQFKIDKLSPRPNNSLKLFSIYKILQQIKIKHLLINGKMAILLLFAVKQFILVVFKVAATTAVTAVTAAAQRIRQYPAEV